jgi:hypothetical protein
MSENTPITVDHLPPSQRGLVNWSEMEAIAIANPGKWVQAPTPLNPAVANQIRKGLYRIDPEKFEVTTRQAEQRGRSWIYLRTR